MQAGQTVTLTELRLAHAELGASSLSAAGSFAYPHERFPLQVQAELQGSYEKQEVKLRWQLADMPGEAEISLAEFKPASIVARAGPVDLARFGEKLPQTALTARIEARTVTDGFAGTLKLANTLAGAIDQSRLPVEGADFSFKTNLETATLEGIRLVLAGGGVLEGTGSASRQSLKASLRASRLDLRTLQTTLRSTALAGPLEIELAPEKQSIRGALAQAGLRLEASAERVGERVTIERLRAEAAGGAAKGAGTIRLDEAWHFDAQVEFTRFNPAAFGRYPEGSLNGTLQARGTLRGPSVEARWTLKASRLLGRGLESSGTAHFSPGRVRGLLGEAEFGASRLTLRGDFGARGERMAWALSVPQLRELLPQIRGRAVARGTLSGSWQEPSIDGALQAEALELPNGTRVRTLTATLAGSMAQHELGATARAADATIELALRGALRAGEWAGEIASLSNKGKYPLKLAAAAPLRLASGRVQLGRFEATLAEGRLLVREALWENGRLFSSGEFGGLPAQWLVAFGGLGERASATMLVDGNWSLASNPRLDGTLRVRRRSGDIVLLGEAPAPLGLSEAILDARFAEGRMSGRLDIASRYGELVLTGSLAPEPGSVGLGYGADSPVALEAKLQLAELPVLAQPYLAESRLDGRLGAELQVAGTLRAPEVNGTVRGDAISFEMPPYGVFLRNGKLRARLDGEHIVVQSFAIEGGAGEISAQGVLPLRFAQGGAKLAWMARNFSVLERPDLRLVASGEGEAGFDGKRLMLSGMVQAERGRFAMERDRIPKLGEDVIVIGQPRVRPRSRPRLPVALDLQLDLGRNLLIEAQGLEGRLEGRLQLATAADGELRAYGRVNMVQATYYAYGQRLQVDPGVLLFDGPLDNPGLQITAWRRNQAVEAGVQVSGNARAPRVQLVSQPPASEGERLSWLVLGRAPSDATKADLGMLQAAAGALLARGEQMPLDRRIARNFGLDEVSFRGSGDVQDRVVAFGKRFSDRLYISYEQGLGTLASNLVKLDFSLGRRWSLRAEAGTSAGAGLYYRYSWD